MMLKRLYDHGASRDRWVKRTAQCGRCDGKGIVIKASLDGVEPCPDSCNKGIVTETIPPVSGVVVMRAGPKQRFSPNVVIGGAQEGWLSLKDDRIIIKGVNRTLRYRILRNPGEHIVGGKKEIIHYYDCELEA